jgi:hypothetical protein
VSRSLWKQIAKSGGKYNGKAYKENKEVLEDAEFYVIGEQALWQMNIN